MYKFAVVITAYNIENYIDEAILSVLKAVKLFSNVQIIVVDDGSTDSTLSKIKMYDDSDFFTLISKNNGGQSSARNAALEAINSEFVMFLDGDDYIEEEIFLSIDKLVTTLSPDIITFDATEFLDDGYIDTVRPPSFSRPEQCYGKILNSVEYFNICIQENKYNVSPCMYFFKAELLNYVSFHEGIMFEDNLFTTDLLLEERNSKVYCLNEPLYCRRLRPSSVMTTLNYDFWFTSLKTVLLTLINQKASRSDVKGYRQFTSNILTTTCFTFWMQANSVKKFKDFSSLLITVLLKWPAIFLSFRFIASLIFGKKYMAIASFIKGKL
ncbi:MULTISPECIES: glycosyltransferase family 2 protein [unclassified Pseudoalteromonas]|uniref:glycosyltransferase family 2 protein n=1 Tax=unclassified Pseudoalteromonas TaxID=194690 RepID=UPI00048D5B55|nr:MULTISPECIES: glycosyltransferase family 2 protein [unclassified Pseudoalteromonas]